MTRTLDILDKLVAFESVTGGPNRDIADYSCACLRQCGARITKIAGPSPAQYGLVATVGPEGPGGIVLSGHTDVVPVAGQDWTRPAFALTREGDRFYGRGTTDMKGFLACMLSTAEQAAAEALRAPLTLVLSYDEEIGCVGIQHMAPALRDALGTPRACIVGEPTNMNVATGHKGKMAFKAICHGQAGHSALAPQFVNAIDLAADVVVALRGLQASFAAQGCQDPEYAVPYSTVHVGKISGGRALNIVPERAEVVFEIRHLAQDAPEVMRAAINSAAQGVADSSANRCIDIEEVAAYPGLDVAQDSPVVSLCKSLAHTEDVTKVAFGTEAGVFHSLGIPTVVCGPGSMAGQGHKADEFLEVSQLDACLRMMERVIDTLRGPDA